MNAIQINYKQSKLDESSKMELPDPADLKKVKKRNWLKVTQKVSMEFDENEIMEIIYMKKAYFRSDEISKQLVKVKDDEVSEYKFDQLKEYRQFMVRRKKHLEIIYTNGITYWSEIVEKSAVNHPYFVQDIMMS